MSFLSNILGKRAEANASVDFEVSMLCGKCVARVKDLLDKNKAIASSQIDLGSKTVSIQYDKNKTNDQQLKSDIEALGFEVSEK